MEILVKTFCCTQILFSFRLGTFSLFLFGNRELSTKEERNTLAGNAWPQHRFCTAFTKGLLASDFLWLLKGT